MFARLPWHEAQWSRIQTAVHRDRLPHAILLGGPAGVGIGRFAETLAATLLCAADAVDDRPCGSCPDCHRLHGGNHADIIRLEPPEAGKTIGIEAVRHVVERLQLTAGRARKVALVQPAEALSVSAANSLLKTLEEPPGGSHILLVSHQSARLPATMRSRCQQIGFSLPPTATSLAWLEAQGVESAADWLARAGGAPLRAAELAAAAEAGGSTDPVEALLAVLLGRRSAVGAAQALGAMPLETAVRAWIAALEDILRLGHVDDPRLVLSWREADLRAAAEQVDVRRLFDYLDQLYRAVPGAGSGLRGPMQLQGLLVEAAGARRDAQAGER